ncbi:MAG: N-acetylglucosamine-6-phosphate deacetylase [Microcystaceae cyanobacterium]
MLKDIILTNARLTGYDDPQQIMINEEGIIEQISRFVIEQPSERQRQILDIKEDWISLGGVDLQINGGLGLAFPQLRPKTIGYLHKICKYLWEQGVDAFLPTLVTTTVDNIHRALSVIDDFMAVQATTPSTSAKILGVHLEGPFLNYEKRGAHPPQHLLTPTVETIQWVLDRYGSIIKIMTLAPELDPTDEVIPYLRSQGIVVSLGHSLATVPEARHAFKLGAKMVTHAFNAMPPLHHRKPGLLGAAILDSEVYCGLIADGQHVSPVMIDLLLRSSGYEQGVFLVSDALAPIGLEDGVYPWDSRQIEVTNGTARLSNRTLAGTTLSLLVGVQNLVKWGVCGVDQAIAMATETPRLALGLKGLQAGQPANLLRWTETENDLTWQRLNE